MAIGIWLVAEFDVSTGRLVCDFFTCRDVKRDQAVSLIALPTHSDNPGRDRLDDTEPAAKGILKRLHQSIDIRW